MRRSKAEILPQELIIEILSRLPAKFIGQYRCVSKQWCNFLSDPQFIKLHLTIHAHNKQERLICISHSHSLHTITFNPQNGNDGVFPQNGNDGVSRNLNFHDNWLRVVGSCNGLVLLENKEKFQFLLNPTTLKYHEIPKFDMALPEDVGVGMSGFGYDVVSDDYKVVTLSYYDDEYAPDVKSTLVDVYSVRKGTWRRLESSPYDHADLGLAYGVFVNGALHWSVRKSSGDAFLIVAFDLNDEKFFEVPTPSTMDNSAMSYDIIALAGCLCMCTDIEEDELVVWMMKEYRVKESWTKFNVRGPNTELGFLPLCFMSDDNVVLNVYREKLSVYNLKEDQWRDMIVDGITAKILKAGIFTESLVSPMFGNGNEGYFIA